MRALALLLSFGACASHGDHAGRADPPPVPPPPLASMDAAMPTSPLSLPDASPLPPPEPGITRGALPSPYDVRVTRVLAEQFPDQAAIDVAVVAMGKLPDINHRVRVLADGGLLKVARSRVAGDWQVPFDQPLPSAPAATVPATTVAAWLAQLADAGFFAHPGYEANPRAQDGTYVIVRARRGAAVTTVVYQNVRPAPIAAVVDAIEAAAAR